MEFVPHVLRFSVFAALLVGAAWIVDRPGLRKSPESDAGAQTLAGFGAGNPDCAEWTNACQICARDVAGAPQCSTPGFACVPGPMVCSVRKPSSPAPLSKP